MIPVAASNAAVNRISGGKFSFGGKSYLKKKDTILEERLLESRQSPAINQRLTSQINQRTASGNKHLHSRTVSAVPRPISSANSYNGPSLDEMNRAGSLKKQKAPKFGEITYVNEL